MSRIGFLFALTLAGGVLLQSPAAAQKTSDQPAAEVSVICSYGFQPASESGYPRYDVFTTKPFSVEDEEQNYLGWDAGSLADSRLKGLSSEFFDHLVSERHPGDRIPNSLVVCDKAEKYHPHFRYTTPWRTWWVLGEYTAEAVNWQPNRKPKNSDLSSETKKYQVWFKSPGNTDTEAEGYNTASIWVDTRFIHCMGEIHFAYSLDPKSLTYSTQYSMPRSRGYGLSVVPDSPPTPPSTIKLRASIYQRPMSHVAVVEDPIAGQSLGMGCFTGQTRKIGTVASMIGPNAKPEQIKEFLNTLFVQRMDEIPYILKHPSPINPKLRAEREAKQRAEAEAKQQALVREAERVYTQMMASGSGKRFEVDPELYPALQQVIARRTAEKNAAYEASMAKWRAETAEAERKKKAWEAEICRLDASKCPQ